LLQDVISSLKLEAVFSRFSFFWKIQSMSNMAIRIIVGAVGIPIVILLIMFGGEVFRALTALIAAIGLLEFYAITGQKGARPNIAIGIAATAAIYAPIFFGLNTNTLLAAAVCMVLATVAIQLWRKGSAVWDITSTLSGVLYFPLLFAFLPAIHAMKLPIDGRFAVLSLFASVWLSDSAAYFGGKLFGRHKLFERVSPKKTWEGAAAGFFGAIIGFAAVGNILMPEVAVIHWLILGGLTGIFGPIGDLAESLLKRDADIKDSSNILPGHGGILDRFDSMTFAAPIMYFYIVFIL